MAQLFSVIPTSPTEAIFENASAKTSGGDSAEESGSDNKGQDGGQTEDITPKEFFWDQFIKYLATAIALLTALDFVLQFLRGGGLFCYPPLGFREDALDATARDQAAYINAYCLGSLDESEFYPVLIVVEGIFLVAPHYLWLSLFGGQFDFFFAIVRQLDRLRSSNSGEYEQKNFELVKRLEKEFPDRRKWLGIINMYQLKLGLQGLIALVSIICNGAVFPPSSFQFVFDCPKDYNSTDTSGVLGWQLPFSVQCVYPSFRVLAKIWYANFVLLFGALLLALYGFLWTIKRHINALGHREIAHFAFTSCLSPDDYVFAPFYRKPMKPRMKNDLDFLLLRLFRADSGHGQVFKDILIDKELNRLINEDRERLHLYLEAIKDEYTPPKHITQGRLPPPEAIWGAHDGDQPSNGRVVPPTAASETGHGRGLLVRDHNGAAPPMATNVAVQSGRDQTARDGARPGGADPQTLTSEATGGPPDETAVNVSDDEVHDGAHEESRTGAVGTGQPEAEVAHAGPRDRDIRASFLNSNFSTDPEKYVFESLLGRRMLGNMKLQESLKSIRDLFFGFLKLVPDNRRVYDISFGTIGYSLILARAFQDVISVNFHPFYRNTEIVRKDKFQVNVTMITVHDEVLSQAAANINLFDEAIDPEFDMMTEKPCLPINFIVVGPFIGESRKATVTLHIERLYNAKYISENALLLAIRPLKIGDRYVWDRFCKYEPAEGLFKEDNIKNDVEVMLTAAAATREGGGNRRERNVKRVTVYTGLTDEENKDITLKGIKVACTSPTVDLDVECIFEFSVYKFEAKYPEPAIPLAELRRQTMAQRNQQQPAPQDAAFPPNNGSMHPMETRLPSRMPLRNRVPPSSAQQHRRPRRSQKPAVPPPGLLLPIGHPMPFHGTSMPVCRRPDNDSSQKRSDIATVTIQLLEKDEAPLSFILKQSSPESVTTDDPTSQATASPAPSLATATVPPPTSTPEKNQPRRRHVQGTRPFYTMAPAGGAAVSSEATLHSSGQIAQGGASSQSGANCYNGDQMSRTSSVSPLSTPV